MLDSETLLFQGGFGTKSGVTIASTKGKKDNHPHEGSVTDFPFRPALILLRCPNIVATPSLLINESQVDKTTLSRNKYGAV